MTSESTTVTSTASSTATTDTLGQFACHHDSDVSESFMVQAGGAGTCEAQVRHLGDLLESCAPGVITTSLLCDVDLRVRQGFTCNAIANTLQSALRKYVRHAGLALAPYASAIDAIRCTNDGAVSGFLSTFDLDTCTNATNLMNMMLDADTSGDFVDCTVVASSTPTAMPTVAPVTSEPTPPPSAAPNTPAPSTMPTAAPSDFGPASLAATCYRPFGNDGSTSVRYLQFDSFIGDVSEACANGRLMAGLKRVAGFCNKTLALECTEEQETIAGPPAQSHYDLTAVTWAGWFVDVDFEGDTTDQSTRNTVNFATIDHTGNAANGHWDFYATVTSSEGGLGQWWKAETGAVDENSWTVYMTDPSDGETAGFLSAELETLGTPRFTITDTSHSVSGETWVNLRSTEGNTPLPLVLGTSLSTVESRFFLTATNGPSDCLAAAGDLSDMLNSFTSGTAPTSLLSCDGTGKIRLDTADCDTIQDLANQMVTSAASGEISTSCEILTPSTTPVPTPAPTPVPTQAVAHFECTALGPKAYLAVGSGGVGACGAQLAMMRPVLEECRRFAEPTSALSCSAGNLVQAGSNCSSVADVITQAAFFFEQQQGEQVDITNFVGPAVCTVGRNIEFATVAECDGTAYQLNRMAEAFVAGTFNGCTEIYTVSPTVAPSMAPTASFPSSNPTELPSTNPTANPTVAPTSPGPTALPSSFPTMMPTGTQGRFACLDVAGEQYLALPDPTTCADHEVFVGRMVQQCLATPDVFGCTSPALAPEASVLRAGVSYANCRAVVERVGQLIHHYSRGSVSMVLDCTRTGMVFVPNGQCGLVTATLNAAIAEIVPKLPEPYNPAVIVDCQTYVITDGPSMAPTPSPTAAPIQLLELGCDQASAAQPNNSYITFNGPAGLAGCQAKIGMLQRLMGACMFAGTTPPQLSCEQVGTDATAVVHVGGGQNCASVVGGLQSILEARSPGGGVQLYCDADGFLLTANDPCGLSRTSTAVDTLNQAMVYFADADYTNCEFTTLSPTAMPTAIPTHGPSAMPSANPTSMPTETPSATPTSMPTFTPCNTFECADECGWDTGTNARDTSSPCGWNNVDLACQEGQVTTLREVFQRQCELTTVTSTATSTATSTVTSTVTTSFDGPACEARASRDVVFAVDGSSFVPFEPVYDLYMDWILDIIQSQPVGSGGFRFGLLVMSASNTVIFGLDNDYTEQASYRDDIQAAIGTFPDDAASASAAMAVVEGMFGPTPDGRGKTLVLVTGGLLGGEVAAGNGASLVNSVNELAANDIEVIPIATGRAEYNLAVELSRPTSAASIGIDEYHPVTAFEVDDDLDVLSSIMLNVSGAIGCDNYKYVKTHEGRTASNAGSPLRFSTGFQTEFYSAGSLFTGATFSDVLPPCAAACDASPTCRGVFVYVDFGASGIQNTCAGLDNLGTAAVSTNTVSYSYSKTPSN
jgi:hypothetical protein